MNVQVLTDDLQDERTRKVHLVLQAPPIACTAPDVHDKVRRHRPEPRILDRKVLVLRDVLGLDFALRVLAHPALERALHALVLVVEHRAVHPAADEHAAADREEAQADVRLAQERVRLAEERRDRRGDAVEDGVEHPVVEEQDRDVGVQEKSQWVLVGAFWRAVGAVLA